MIATTTPIRKPELWVRDRLLRKSSSVAGNGLVSFSGVSSWAFSPAAGGLCVVCSIRLLSAFQILFDAVFRIANSVSQFNLREVMRIKTLNVTLVSTGKRFLRLYHFQVVGYTCDEAVLRLGKCLLRQIDGTACHSHLFRGGVQVEQCTADFVVDAAAQVSQLRPRLLQLGVGFVDVAVSPIAGEDGDVNPAIHLPGPIRLGRGDADIPEIRIDVYRGIVSGGGRPA